MIFLANPIAKRSRIMRCFLAVLLRSTSLTDERPQPKVGVPSLRVKLVTSVSGAEEYPRAF